MNAVEWLVIAIGAAAGYWLVDFLFKGRSGHASHNGAPQGAHAEPDEPGMGRIARPSLAWPQVLGLPPDASLDEIRSARDRHLQAYHPDKVADLGPELRQLAKEKSDAITAAYQAAVAERGGPT